MLAALAIVAVLAVIGAIALPSLLGGGGDPPQGNRSNEQAAVGGSNREGGGGQDQGSGGNSGGTEGSGNTPQGATPSGGAEETPAPSGDGSGQDGQQGEQQAQDESPEQAAEETIREFYQTAAGPNYEDSWNYLSSGYQQELGTRGAMTDQFQTLQSVRFTSGPSAQVDGDTATVSFSTVAQHTDRVDRPSLTATLVNEDGEWKIDSL